MPPPGEPRPEAAELESFVSWMEARLDAAQPEPDPGYTVLHRLNRHEYANAIKDLLALDVHAEDWLPVDGVEEGFDNTNAGIVKLPDGGSHAEVVRVLRSALARK
jgi:hypothetical protein